MEHVEYHLRLYKEYYKEELNVKLKYIQPLHSAAVQVAEKMQHSKVKRIEKIHQKQKAELLRLMHHQRKDKLRELQQHHRDKHEMGRMKREFEQKHVGRMVELFEWLKDYVVENCKKTLETNMRSLLEELQTSISEQQDQHEKSCVEKITLKEQELIAAVHAWNNGETKLATEEEPSGQDDISVSNPQRTESSSSARGASPNGTASSRFDPIVEEETEDTHL